MKRIALLALALLVSGCSSPSTVRPSPVPSPAAVLPLPVTLPAPSIAPPVGIAPFSDADVVVPPWPASAKQCVSGRVHISDGGQFLPAQEGKTAINIMTVLPVDFDADGTDEYAVYVMCGEGPESGGRMIVGYRRAGKAFAPIGRIIGTQDGFAMMDYLHRKGNGIEVFLSREYTDAGPGSGRGEWRTYELRGHGFRQVGTTVHPASVRLSVEPRQIVMRRVGGVRTGSVQLTVRNEGTATAPLIGIRLQLPESFQPAGAHWTGCAAEGAGSFFCPLKDLAGGGSVDVSYEVLGPNEPPSSAPSGTGAPLAVAVYSQSLEVFDESASEPVPLNVVFP